MQLFFRKNVGNCCVKSLFQSRCGKELPVFETRTLFTALFIFTVQVFLLITWQRWFVVTIGNSLDGFRIVSYLQ